MVTPAHNEAECIAEVVADVVAHTPRAEVVVVDDGSTDRTADVARSAGATVISLPYNMGISGAVQTGYRYAVADHDIVVRVDGDGQHEARFIERLMAPILAGEADMVIGSRFSTAGGYKPPRSRALGIRFFSFLVAIVTGQRFSDTTSGFHACTRAVACFLADNMPDDYPEIESLVLLCRRFRVREVAVTMRERQTGTSSIGRMQAFYYVLKVTLAVLIDLLRTQTRRG